jgi:hypothetical protein
MSASFTIALTESELVVLHDVLGKLSDREDFERLVPDRGDQQAIHNLVCLFERGCCLPGCGGWPTGKGAWSTGPSGSRRPFSRTNGCRSNRSFRR